MASSSWSSSWPSPPKFKNPPKKQEAGHGNIVVNLLHDVRDAAVGFPAGLVHLVKDPIGSLKTMGRSTWYSWSPLFEGDVKEFEHRFVEHPLAPLLDVASVLTIGAGAVAKGAGGIAKVGIASETSAIGRLAEYSKGGTLKYTSEAGPDLFKPTSKNPLTRKRQEAIHGLMKQIDVPIFGHAASYSRLENRAMSGRAAGMQAQIQMFVKAGKDLSGPDKAKFEELALRRSYWQTKKFATSWTPGKVLPRTKDGKVTYTYLRAINSRNRSIFYKIKPGTSFESVMERFGRRYTTRSEKFAAKDVHGNPLIVPLHQVEKFGREGANSSRAVKLLYRNPTKVWKWILLGTRPAYFVNNAVGNHFMYAMGQGGGKAVRGYVDALAFAIGEKRTLRSMGEAAKATRAINSHWLNKHFLDQINDTFSSATAQSVGARLSKYSLFPITHAVTDQLLRRATIFAELRKTPEVRELMKTGVKFDEAADRVLSKNRAIRDGIASHVQDILGDYHSLTAVERELSSLVPFYAWNRHAIRFGKHITSEHPGRTDFVAKTGQMGIDEMDDLLGEVPSFLKGALPVEYLPEWMQSVLGKIPGVETEGKHGRIPILQTEGLNPLATIPDVLDLATAPFIKGDLRPGETVGGQLNPFLVGTAEWLFERDLLTGAPKPHKHGLIPSVATGVFENLPQLNMLEAWLNGAPTPRDPDKPFMFKKDLAQYGLQFSGLPIKQMSRERAKSAAKREREKTPQL